MEQPSEDGGPPPSPEGMAAGVALPPPTAPEGAVGDAAPVAPSAAAAPGGAVTLGAGWLLSMSWGISAWGAFGVYGLLAGGGRRCSRTLLFIDGKLPSFTSTSPATAAAEEANVGAPGSVELRLGQI
jgi:hypothetical protein